MNLRTITSNRCEAVWKYEQKYKRMEVYKKKYGCTNGQSRRKMLWEPFTKKSDACKFFFEEGKYSFGDNRKMKGQNNNRMEA